MCQERIGSDGKIKKRQVGSWLVDLAVSVDDSIVVIIAIVVVLVVSAVSPPMQNYCANAIVNVHVNMIRRGMVKKKDDGIDDIDASLVRTGVRINKLSEQSKFRKQISNFDISVFPMMFLWWENLDIYIIIQKIEIIKSNGEIDFTNSLCVCSYTFNKTICYWHLVLFLE